MIRHGGKVGARPGTPGPPGPLRLMGLIDFCKNSLIDFCKNQTQTRILFFGTLVQVKANIFPKFEFSRYIMYVMYIMYKTRCNL